MPTPLLPSSTTSLSQAPSNDVNCQHSVPCPAVHSGELDIAETSVAHNSTCAPLASSRDTLRTSTACGYTRRHRRGPASCSWNIASAATNVSSSQVRVLICKSVGGAQRCAHSSKQFIGAIPDMAADPLSCQSDFGGRQVDRNRLDLLRCPFYTFGPEPTWLNM